MKKYEFGQKCPLGIKKVWKFQIEKIRSVK